ncbi:hypothetical protein L7F22_046387 [Adiantum nelumboides]|nr:hypothetical protein [Adiantum nelumboides]
MRKEKEKQKDEVEYKNKSGTAWSHSYLNQKPWHPLSYPNQRRKWIAEQTHAEHQRRTEDVARELSGSHLFYEGLPTDPVFLLTALGYRRGTLDMIPPSMHEVDSYSRDIRRDDILAIVDSRWEFMRRPIHGMAAILHPFYKTPELFADIPLLTLRSEYLNLMLSEDDQLVIDGEMSSFMNNLGPTYLRSVATRSEATRFPLSWWQNYGRQGLPQLCKLALRVLSQDCSAGACERNWSAYSLVHTKIRNRLSTTQLEKLVYCRSNMRLVRSFHALGNPKQFAQEQEFFRTSAMLSKKEREKLEVMQAVSFMYMRPPGYNAESARAAEIAEDKKAPEDDSLLNAVPAEEKGVEAKKPRVKDLYGRTIPTEEEFPVLKNAPRMESGTSARVKPFAVEIRNVKCARCGAFGHQSGDRECPLKDSIMTNDEARQKRDDPLTSIMSAVADEPLKWELKHKPGGLSPPRGGFRKDDPNQQIIPEDIYDEYGGFLAGGGEVHDLLASLPKMKHNKKKRKKHRVESSSSESSREIDSDRDHRRRRKLKEKKKSRESTSQSNSDSDCRRDDRRRRRKRKHKEKAAIIKSKSGSDNDRDYRHQRDRKEGKRREKKGQDK